jgi:hypothetical protein
MADKPEPGHLLRLPHEVLVNLFVRLDSYALARLAATCRLLQYSQSSPQTPSPVEDALWLRAELRGWSRTLPVASRGAVRYFLRLARQDELEFHSISASWFHPISLFVDAAGSLHACGVEIQRNENTESFLDGGHAAPAGCLGFGPGWCADSHAAYLRKEGPTPVPAAEGVRLRSVAICGAHSLALTDEGRIYTWGGHVSPSYTWGGQVPTSRTPEIPTLFQDISEIKVRQVASGAWHSAALTDEGKLYTWYHSEGAYKREQSSAAGAGYPLPPDLGGIADALYRPRCVETLRGVRIVSVSAGVQYTLVATDTGAAFSPPTLCTGCEQAEGCEAVERG